MSSSSTKKPPQLSLQKSYTDWVRLVNIWVKFTDLSDVKRGPALVMVLEGKALDAILELTDDEISSAEGITKMIAKLDTVYKKDELNQKFEDLEKFENYKRSSSEGIQEFITHFDMLHSKAKKHGSSWSDDVLGFRLLKSANLPARDEQLIKATITEIKYNIVKNKIKSIFTDNEKPSASAGTDPFAIKSEPTFFAEDEEEALEYDDAQETFYVPNRFRNAGRSRSNYYYRSNFPSRYSKYPGPSSSADWRQTSSSRTAGFGARVPNANTMPPRAKSGKNPVVNGEQTKCNICQSINHWATECPDKPTADITCMVNEIVLHSSNDVVLKSLVAETWSCAVLDSGASSTVCGKNWFAEYLSSLSDEDKKRVTFSPSHKPFKFGDGRSIQSTECAKFPAHFGDNAVSIEADIVDAEIPLLFSRSSMKKAKMHLDFNHDVATIFGESIPLLTTSTGLYAVPIMKPVQLINKIIKCPDEQVILTTRNVKSNKDIAIKLHRCFAHPSSDKIIRLINQAGPKWADNLDLKEEVKSVSENCTVCKIFKKPPPRPAVSLPMSTEFQDVVAMDLKFYNGKIILHLIDLCSRLSAAIFIPDKTKETVTQAIARIWIYVYGTLHKFMNGNGGEFANSDFLEMCEQFGIVPLTTAAESPWSNGVVERNNQTLARMMDKIISDSQSNPELALCWALAAKNSLQNVAGFSPYQLAIGYNPRLPSTLHDELPALSNKPSSKIIEENLKALHAARCAFIESENCEKIRRALVHNVRSSGDVKYITGDSVFYKRNDSSEWHGPANVIGQVGQQVHLKHGAFHIRVHPCRLQLTSMSQPQSPKQATSSDKSPSVTPNVKDLHDTDSDNDDDDHHSPLQDISVVDNSANPDQIGLDQQSLNSSSLLEQSILPSNSPNLASGLGGFSNSDSELDCNLDRQRSGVRMRNRSVSLDSSARACVSGTNGGSRQDPLHIPPSVSSSDDPDEFSKTWKSMEISNKTNNQIKGKLKPHTQIKYKDNPEDNWIIAVIDGRAGKACGKRSTWWNITCSDGSQKSINLAEKIWDIINNVHSVDSTSPCSAINLLDSTTDAAEQLVLTDTITPLGASESIHVPVSPLCDHTSQDHYSSSNSSQSEHISPLNTHTSPAYNSSQSEYILLSNKEEELSAKQK